VDRPSISDVLLRKLDNGDLPRRLPRKMLTGPGRGALCDACDDPIRLGQLEYEWTYPDQPRVFRMHMGCAGIWEALRRQPGFDPAF
jgi:hypothetical protein